MASFVFLIDLKVPTSITFLLLPRSTFMPQWIVGFAANLHLLALDLPLIVVFSCHHKSLINPDANRSPLLPCFPLVAFLKLSRGTARVRYSGDPPYSSPILVKARFLVFFPNLFFPFPLALCLPRCTFAVSLSQLYAHCSTLRPRDSQSGMPR